MAISSPRDQNRVVCVMATLNTDGLTPVVLGVDSTNSLLTNDGASGSGFPSTDAQRDANRIPVIWGLSDANDGTIIPIYATSNGSLLTRST